MKKKEEHLNFIKQFRVGEKVFLLGQYEKRITIYSQQLRALNLIHSLFKSKEISINTTIGIIGGGIGGLTLAYSCAVLGLRNITVFEKNEHLFQTWGSSPRWIDPFLFSWPFKEWKNKKTQLPFFNWSCDLASNVSKLFFKEQQVLQEHFPTVTVNRNTNSWIDKSTFKVGSGNRGALEKYDKIFLATGFGYDGKTNDEQSTYWAADNLSMLANRDLHFYISGIGDGGLANLFRLKINGFDFNFLRASLLKPEMENITKEIIKIENEAKNMYWQKRTLESISDFLKKEYKNIECPKFENELKYRLKNNKISIQAKSNTLYNIKAFPLNRFLLSRLLKVDSRIDFYPHMIVNLKELKKPIFSLSSQKIHHSDVTNAESEIIESDFFISRHGPLRPLDSKTFSHISQHKDAKEIRSLNLLDVTGREKLFNKKFFKLSKLLTQDIESIKISDKKINPYKTIDFFPQPQNLSLIDHISKEFDLARNELEIPNKVFKTEHDYLEGLMEVLPHLPEGSKINAVCGNKEWKSLWVKKYFKMNYEATMRGVEISRIFLLQKGMKGKQQENTMREQENNNIKVYRLSEKIGSKVMNENLMPDTFGFAVISNPINSKIVIVHDLSKENDGFVGVKFTSQILVRHYLDFWHTLFNYIKL